MYASRFFNRAQQNYSTTKIKALITIFVLHKFKHYFLGNKFVFYVDHMALVYLVNKPKVSTRIIRWLLLFLEYDFTIMYKLGKTHVITNALSRLLDIKTHRCALSNHRSLLEILSFATSHYVTGMQLLVICNYLGHVCNYKFSIV